MRLGQCPSIWSFFFGRHPLGKLSKSKCKKPMEFSICRGLMGSFSICFLDLTLLFFSFVTPPFHSTISIFGLLGGKNKNILELPKTDFNDIKKICRFSIC